LSETISFTAASEVGIFDQDNESYDTGVEEKNPLWDRDDLTPLVGANANVPVMWQGVETTLSDAISSYLAMNPVSEETQDIAIAVVLELLANGVVETEEPGNEDEETAETDEPEEEEPAETQEPDQTSSAKPEVQKLPASTKTVDTQPQPNNQIDEPEHLEPPTIRAEAVPVPEPSQAIEAKAEAAGSSLNSSTNIANEARASAPETPSVINHATGNSAPESVSVIDKTAQEFTPVSRSVEHRPGETKPAAKSEVAVKQPIPILEKTTTNAIDPEIESIALPAAVETAAEPEPTELSPSDFETATTTDEIAEISYEEIAVADDEPLVTFDYRIAAGGPNDFNEEVRLDQTEEIGLEPDELYEFSYTPSLEIVADNLVAEDEVLISPVDDELDFSKPIKTTAPEQIVQRSLTIQEIEDSLIQLTERIEASQPETAEKLNDILDKIIEVPLRFETENIITEVQAQDELEALFTELLDITGVDYTPELVECLVRLTLERHLVDEIKKLKRQEQTDKAPQGIGTHEIIKKLLLSLSTLKKTLAQAGAIGKSALRLSKVNCAT
jgi:hypothetical protein